MTAPHKPQPRGMFVFNPQAGNTPAGQLTWDFLAEFETTLPNVKPTGLGQHTGDDLILQWWMSNDLQHFAIQAIDQTQCSHWELFCVPVGTGTQVLGYRMLPERGTPAEPSALQGLLEVLGPQIGGLHQSARHPSFLEVVTAGAANATVRSVIVDGIATADLQADLDYWRTLAKDAVKALDRAEKAQSSLARPSTAQSTNQEVEPEAEAEARQWTLKDMGEWAALNSDRITILPRAISEAKKSPYENHALVYQCLELLAHEYSGTKRGDMGRHAFKAKADALGLEYGGSVDPSVAGMLGSQYFIRWRGRRRFLDQHLTHGNARNPRYCMRIYFTWDEHDQRVVVGWLPSHLGTSGS